MVLKLLIRKQSDPSFLQELEFNSFPVFLGREDTADITLPDPFRVISRKHAQILDTEGILQIVDLNSANFTYLNNLKLEPNEENPLKSGDKIKIGDYELDVELTKPKDQNKAAFEDDQKTIIFSSPYKDEISSIADNLNKIAMKYISDNSPMKSEALKFSFGQSFKDIDNSDVSRIFAEFLQENTLVKNKDYFPDKLLNIQKSSSFEDISAPQKTQFSSKNSHAAISIEAAADYPFSSHFTKVIDILLDMFSKLTQGFQLFRQEFFGVTIFYQLPADSLKELKEYLFNPAILPEEESKRIELLKEETQKLLSHQVGMLEGYKSAITEGTRLMLQSLDPENIENEKDSKEKNKQGFDKFLSGLSSRKKFDMIKEHYRKYISDPYHVEKKFFRPAFIKGYQKRTPGKSQNEF